MLRDLERTPILAREGVVLSKKAKRDIRRLAERLGPSVDRVESRWLAGLPGIFGAQPDAAKLRALSALNFGQSVGPLSSGIVEDYIETVEYHSRRLAKLDVSPAQAAASIDAYRKALQPVVRKLFPETHAEYASALDHLDFTVKLTMNNAYYQVRDLEATAFYDVLQDQLETLRVKDLLNRVLETLTRTFRADGGVIILSEAGSDKLTVNAWKGMSPHLARCFNAKVGVGVLGEVAAAGEPEVVVDVASESRIGSRKIRETFHSLWVVPLPLRGHVTGVVALAFGHEYSCLPREMKLFVAIAERCALAIEKAQLLEELREREEQIRALGEHMMKVEEEERRRISRELHDEVGQSLLVVRLYMEMIQTSLPPAASPVAEKLDETRKMVEGIIVEMRRLISALSPSVLQELGLEASIRQFIKNLGRTFQGGVRLRMARMDRLPEGANIMIYRLVQECFTNAVKHSGADNVNLHLSRHNGAVRMKLRDDGIGFDLDNAEHKRDSFGLSGMRERVLLLGGDIDIDTAPGRGTKVSITIPV